MSQAPAQRKDFGVFLPIANGGWIISTTTPKLDGSWEQNRDAAVIADQIGMDFVMSMGKFRGFGGKTDHWGTALESITMMSAIAPLTTRVKLWTTVHPLLQNPAVTAKMMATLDQISGGRAGLNVVAGAYRDEFEQMGMWDDTLNHDDRYDYAEEWLTIIKELWRDGRSDRKGRFFQMSDCQSKPMPASKPRPDIIAAGMSERGFRFATDHADACFIGGYTTEERKTASLAAKAFAAGKGHTIKTYAMCTVVHAETDGEAKALADHYDAGVDLEAVMAQMRAWGVPEAKVAETAKKRGAFQTETAIGSPSSCTAQIASFVEDCELDGLMMIFPDYVEGLTMFGSEILPRLRAQFS
jgi:pyrimidine oxygenase